MYDVIITDKITVFIFCFVFLHSLTFLTYIYIYEYYGGGKTCCIFFTQHINIFSTQSVAAAVEISQICNIIITVVFYEKYILLQR